MMNGPLYFMAFAINFLQEIVFSSTAAPSMTIGRVKERNAATSFNKFIPMLLFSITQHPLQLASVVQPVECI